MLALPFTATATILLLSLGAFLIAWELNRPGSILPGALGLIITLVGFASVAKSPHGGRTLVLLAIAACFLVYDLRRPRYFGALCCCAAWILAYLSLISSENMGWNIVLALGCGAGSGLSTAILARIAHRARRNKGLD